MKPLTTLRCRSAVHERLQVATNTGAELSADAEVDETLALHMNHWCRRRRACQEGEIVVARLEHLLSEFSKHVWVWLAPPSPEAEPLASCAQHLVDAMVHICQQRCVPCSASCVIFGQASD